MELKNLMKEKKNAREHLQQGRSNVGQNQRPREHKF